MIDSGMFDKNDIVEWENEDVKTWTNATFFFEACMEEEDIYTAVVGGTGKKTRFESAQNTTEESRDDLKEQAEEGKINNNDRIQAYLGSFAEAAAAKEERIQEITTAASSKDSELAEIIARMEARDEARDAQIRLKDKQIGELIEKLTAMLVALPRQQRQKKNASRR